MSMPPPQQSWGGQCPIHYTQYPCPLCTSGVVPEPFYPSVPSPVYPNTYPEPVPAPYIDPWMYQQYPLMPVPRYGFEYTPLACEHCFCQESDRPDHESCCNCGVNRLKAPFGGVEPGWEFEQGHWHHDAFDDD